MGLFLIDSEFVELVFEIRIFRLTHVFSFTIKKATLMNWYVFSKKKKVEKLILIKSMTNSPCVLHN